MTGDERENDLIRSVALQNASSILIARQRAEVVVNHRDFGEWLGGGRSSHTSPTHHIKCDEPVVCTARLHSTT